MKAHSLTLLNATSLTDVTKVALVLRLEILFSVLAGGYFFKVFYPETISLR